jgi:transcription initiation factor TFIIB
MKFGAKKCPECGNTNLYINEEKGEVICKECGLVIEDKMIDFSQEWREFDSSGESARRGGAPLTYTQADKGLGTQVGSSTDLSALRGKDRQKFYRLQQWQRRVSTAIERNLRMALTEIKRISSNLNLPDSVEEEASRIYTLAVQKGLVRGRSMEQVVAGTMYITCKRNDSPRTLEEISEVTGLEKKEVAKNSRFVARQLNIKVLPVSPVTYIARFASELKISPATQTKAVKLIERAQKVGLTSGKSPKGVAAASIYVSSLLNAERKTQSKISEISGVTEVTIRNRYKERVKALALEDEIRKSKKLLEEENEKALASP